MTKYPDDADGEALANLADQGADMSQEFEFEFAVDAPDEASAESIREALEQAGYDTDLYFDDGEPEAEADEDLDDDSESDSGEDAEDADDEESFGPSWTVYALVRMKPEYDEVIRIQAELDKLAAPFGGASDGWGVMVEGDEEDEDSDDEGFEDDDED